MERMTVLNAELKSMNSILTDVLWLCRWVRWSALEIVSSVDLGGR